MHTARVNSMVDEAIYAAMAIALTLGMEHKKENSPAAVKTPLFIGTFIERYDD
jgi:hypothetical protein